MNRGRIRIYDTATNTIRPAPFLDIAEKVAAGNRVCRIGSTIVAPNVPALPWPALLGLAIGLAAAAIAVKKPRPFAVLPRLLRSWHALGE